MFGSTSAKVTGPADFQSGATFYIVYTFAGMFYFDKFHLIGLESVAYLPEIDKDFLRNFLRPPKVEKTYKKLVIF